MKLYTKGGDKGHTSLIGGERTSKCDLRVEAYGTVDELSAFTALLHDQIAERHNDISSAYTADLVEINRTLMSVEAILACGSESKGKIAPIPTEQIEWLEGRIDALQAATTPISYFTIPGGCSTVSLCHVCRTICRRAERAAIKAAEQYDTDSSALVYLNRLSDYFYALGRQLTECLKVEEILWRP